MACVTSSFCSWLLLIAVLALVLHASPVAAFGAGNIGMILGLVSIVADLSLMEINSLHFKN